MVLIIYTFSLKPSKHSWRRKGKTNDNGKEAAIPNESIHKSKVLHPVNWMRHQTRFQDFSKGGGARILETRLFPGKEGEIASEANEKFAREASKYFYSEKGLCSWY